MARSHPRAVTGPAGDACPRGDDPPGDPPRSPPRAAPGPAGGPSPGGAPPPGAPPGRGGPPAPPPPGGPEAEPLLKELARDGRASTAALAAAIHWHESTVRRRIDELRRSGLL